MDLFKLTYKITENFPGSELFGVTNQLRRASVSIASNLAEGCARKSVIERKKFFEISRSSLVEVDAQLEISKELNFISESAIINFDQLMNVLSAKLSNLILKAN